MWHTSCRCEKNRCASLLLIKINSYLMFILNFNIICIIGLKWIAYFSNKKHACQIRKLLYHHSYAIVVCNWNCISMCFMMSRSSVDNEKLVYFSYTYSNKFYPSQRNKWQVMYLIWTRTLQIGRQKSIKLPGQLLNCDFLVKYEK